MKYEFIKENRSEHRVKKMCEVLDVNESGYYRWLRKKPSEREKQEIQLVEKMRIIHEANFHSYGATRMQRELAKENLHYSIGKIARLM